jgi:hypothetical protein
MLRSEVQARTGASALAVATTVLLSAATLLAGTYRVTTCFSRPDGVGGCGTVVYPFSLQALPALIWPSALFATLIVLAAFAWRTSSNKLAAIATTTYAALAGGATLLVAPLLSVAVVLLVLAYSLRTGRRLRWAFIDLAIAISLTALAIASAYTLLFAATLWRGGWLGGIAPAMWVYVAFAAAVAIGVGCALAPRAEGERLPFARAALVAFGVCGVAGAVGLILLGGVPELKAAAVRSLVGIAAVAVPLGAAALWGVLRIQRRQALVGAFVAAIAFPICIVVLIGTLTSIAPGSISPASSIGPDLPRVPWLPGTSTLP